MDKIISLIWQLENNCLKIQRDKSKGVYDQTSNDLLIESNNIKLYLIDEIVNYGNERKNENEKS